MPDIIMPTNSTLDVTIKTKSSSGYGYDVQHANDSGIVHIEELANTLQAQGTLFGESFPQTFRITGKKPGTYIFKSVRPWSQEEDIAGALTITIT